MKSERIRLVSVLAARAQFETSPIHSPGRRGKSVKHTVLAQCAQGNQPGYRSLEKREFRKGRSADEIGT